jgi:hypothetical protein
MSNWNYIIPIIEIDGIGRVEVDDSFLQMSPAQQDATIAEIVQSAAPQGRNPHPATQGPTAPASAPQPGAMGQIDAPAMAPEGPSPSSAPRRATDFDFGKMEAEYQAQQRSQGRTYANAPAAEKTTALGAAGLGAIDGLSFGFDDEVGSGLASIIPGIGKRSIWDGSSLSDAFDANVDAYRKTKDAAWNEHPAAYIGGGVASALVPFGAAGKLVAGGRGIVKAVQGLEEASQLATKAKLLKAAIEGAKAGAVYGAGSDTGNPLDRLDGAALGAIGGAVGGAGLQALGTGAAKAVNPVLEKLSPKLADARFASSQAGNPHVVTDAAVSADLDKLVRTMTAAPAKAKLNSKAQRRILLDRVSELERSYLPVEEINALDVPPSVKTRLTAAMAKRHLLSDAEVSAIADGTPAGDAVAEGIAKVRRLRAYVADVNGEGGSGAGKVLAEAVGSAAGWKLGGPIGGAAGSVLGRLAAPSGAKDAAKAATDLAAKARAFSKLPEVLAAKEAGNAGGDGLSRLAAEALDARYLAKQSARLEAERLAAEGHKVGIANARDNVKPSGGWRGLVYERTGLLPADQDAGALAALNDGAISPEQFDAFLNAPDKLMAGNSGNALTDRLAHMADNGRLKRDPKWQPQATATVAPVVREGNWSSIMDVPQDVQDEALQAFLSANPGATAAMSTDDAGRLVVSVDPEASQAAIRNPIAYRATADANQRRVSDTLAAVHGNGDLGDGDREILASTVAELGSTSSKAKAQALASDAIDRLPETHRPYARSILLPLVSQVKK